MTAIRSRMIVVDAESAPLKDAAIVFNETGIIAVSPWADVRDDLVDVIEIDGVLIPGMVDAHSHLRGLPYDAHGIPDRPFESWICSLAAMASLDPADEALVAATGLLETGVTSVQGFVDPGTDETSALEVPARTLTGLSAAGIRALVVLGFWDRAMHTPEPPEGEWALVPSTRVALPVDAVDRVARQWLGQLTDTTITLGIGPVGGQWSSDKLLSAIVGAAGDARLHTHLHESRLHRSWLAGLASPLDRLDKFGFLNDRLSGAHGVHLTPLELDRIAASGASLVHCPISNDAMHVGTAHVAEWLRRGIPSGLGSDSQNVDSPDMFDVMRAAKGVRPTQSFAMATTGGAQALGIPGGGRIAVGSPADFVELALDDDSIDHIVETASAASVRRVWVGGRLVVSGGRSLVDATAARGRLIEQLDRDLADRERRLAEQATTVDLVERLAGAMA